MQLIHMTLAAFGLFNVAALAACDGDSGSDDSGASDAEGEEFPDGPCTEDDDCGEGLICIAMTLASGGSTEKVCTATCEAGPCTTALNEPGTCKAAPDNRPICLATHDNFEPCGPIEHATCDAGQLCVFHTDSDVSGLCMTPCSSGCAETQVCSEDILSDGVGGGQGVCLDAAVEVGAECSRDKDNYALCQEGQGCARADTDDIAGTCQPRN